MTSLHERDPPLPEPSALRVFRPGFPPVPDGQGRLGCVRGKGRRSPTGLRGRCRTLYRGPRGGPKTLESERPDDPHPPRGTGPVPLPSVTLPSETDPPRRGRPTLSPRSARTPPKVVPRLEHPSTGESRPVPPVLTSTFRRPRSVPSRMGWGWCLPGLVPTSLTTRTQAPVGPGVTTLTPTHTPTPLSPSKDRAVHDEDPVSWVGRSPVPDPTTIREQDRRSEYPTPTPGVVYPAPLDPTASRPPLRHPPRTTLPFLTRGTGGAPEGQ